MTLGGGGSKIATPKSVFQGGFLKTLPKSHENLKCGGNFLTTTSKILVLMTFFV